MENITTDLANLRSILTSGNEALLSDMNTVKLTSRLKIAIVELKLDSNNVDLLALCQNVLETLVLYSLFVNDERGFERYYSQLKAYYFDSVGHNVPKSENKYSIVGAYFLFLLAENRIAEFHTELERLSDDMVENPFIQYSIQLEQSKMEGSYNKIMNSVPCPAEYYNRFKLKLVNTSRHDIADSLEKAYGTLKLTETMSQLLFHESKCFEEFVNERHWRIEGDRIFFGDGAKGQLAKLDSFGLMSQNLAYAVELERII